MVKRTILARFTLFFLRNPYPELAFIVLKSIIQHLITLGTNYLNIYDIRNYLNRCSVRPGILSKPTETKYQMQKNRKAPID